MQWIREYRLLVALIIVVLMAIVVGVLGYRHMGNRLSGPADEDAKDERADRRW